MTRTLSTITINPVFGLILNVRAKPVDIILNDRVLVVIMETGTPYDIFGINPGGDIPYGAEYITTHSINGSTYSFYRRSA